MVNRRVVLCTNEGTNSQHVNDIAKSFDCLKISILNKASQISDKFDKVTLGPDAVPQDNHDSNSPNDDQARINNSSLNGLSSRSNITFSIKKILLENEIQRREKVKKAVDRKKKEMEKSQREIKEDLSQLLSRIAIQREKETAEKLAALEAEEELLAQQLEIDRKNEKQRQRLKESDEISKKIIPYRENFHAKWKDIANISVACRDKNSASRLLAPHVAKLKELSLQMESINEKTRTGDLTAADIKMAEILVQYNDEVFQLFKADIDKIDALYNEEIARREMEVRQAELKAQEEMLRAKQLQDVENSVKASEQFIYVEPQKINHEQDNLAEQNQQPAETDSVSVGSHLSDYSNVPVSVTAVALTSEVAPVKETDEISKYPDCGSLQTYIDNHQFLENYASTYQDFIRSDAMKKFKFECQKCLNITINSISHTSREQLLHKYEKLRLFLSGPSVSQNPQAQAYSKNLLAQKIVDQGDTTISSKPELAFPFAAIAVALWNDWPDFGALLLARFRKKSPFFIPVFLVPNKDQSEDEYCKSLGCKYTDAGIPEKPEQFWKRLGGIMYLYASIMVTRQRQGMNKSHPHGLGNAWKWLATTLNTEPRCDIADVCATLIYTILEVTGNDLWKTYPNQFPKMLLILNNVYYEKLKSFDPVISAPISRLGELLTNALKTGSIAPPKGQLSPNFW
ncbi:PREDICTED: nucleoporin GLE1 [Ceratosolen solmsi marchali]|uniref:mRNA export factor GLE1 n=1 Tax=Ceratosolen solmsi marchali TaxID=326594 RepID=A0AAJ6YBF9_9HYME|nr:PREDICTED: nucleoporin GLE1 [Ceratosolen solmsi marchali]